MMRKKSDISLAIPEKGAAADDNSFRRIPEKLHEAFLAISRDGSIVDVNQPAVDLLGYKRRELPGTKVWDLYADEEDRVRVRQELTQRGIVSDYGVLLRKNNGEAVECIFTIMASWENNAIGRYQGIIRDIGAQKGAEAVRLYRMLVNNSQAGAYVVQKGVFLFVNPHVAEYSGYSEGELVGRKTLDIVYPDDRIVTRQHAIEMLKGLRRTPYEYRLIARDGSIRWILENVTSIDFFGRRAVLGNSMDITDFMEAKQRLIDAEALESSILNAMPHAVLGMKDRRIIFANNAVEKVLGWRSDELIGRKSRLLYRSEEDYQEIGRRFYKALETEDVHIEEFPCLRKDGREILCFMSGARVGSTLDRKRIVVVYEDVSERKRAEQALRESEEKYSAVVEQAVYGVVIVQNDLIIFANQAMAAISGYPVEELVGKVFAETFAPASRAVIRRRLRNRPEGQRRPPVSEVKLLCRNGSIKDGEIAFGAIRIKGETVDMAYVRDITDRKRAQKELRLSVEQLNQRLTETVKALSSMTEKRDPYTAGHQERVTQLAAAIAEKIGFSRERLKGLVVAATLHDIGKIYEPAEILSKPDLLTYIEFLMMKVHPEIGFDILRTIDFPWPVAQIVYQHHERLDGTGYPESLKGEEILLEARILAVADVVEAMASHRPYRSSLGIDAALEEIRMNRGTLYDARAVDACLELFDRNGFTFRYRDISKRRSEGQFPQETPAGTVNG
ncbi:MAG: PAS domain S-box protein [Deltaproteobacteria bacterium]|nr:PAS domain S-box protein [Deltaproteobacteria bacterium]